MQFIANEFQGVSKYTTIINRNVEIDVEVEFIKIKYWY